MMSMSRPSFMVQGRTYVSAGILPYTMDLQGNFHFLFQRLTSEDRRWTYEDFGGKSEAGDTSILNVALREFQEESNGIDTMRPEFLREQLKDNRSIVYKIPESKYILFLIYIPLPHKETMDLSLFGTTNHDGMTRNVEWLSYKSVMELDDHRLHPRFIPIEFKNNLALVLAYTVMCPGQKHY